LKQGGLTAVYGLSTQSTAYQQEAADRLHLPFQLLSDESWAFAKALRLPSFYLPSENAQFLQRVTLLLKDGRVEKVFYPVFPPDKNAEAVLEWLDSNKPA
jgi:peroxiredoxin